MGLVSLGQAHQIDWFRRYRGLTNKSADLRARTASTWPLLAAFEISDANLTMNGWL